MGDIRKWHKFCIHNKTNSTLSRLHTEGITRTLGFWSSFFQRNVSFMFMLTFSISKTEATWNGILAGQYRPTQFARDFGLLPWSEPYTCWLEAISLLFLVTYAIRAHIQVLSAYNLSARALWSYEHKPCIWANIHCQESV